MTPLRHLWTSHQDWRPSTAVAASAVAQVLEHLVPLPYGIRHIDPELWRDEAKSRQLPSPIIETARRLRLLADIIDYLSGSTGEILLTGSLSYGRFYSITPQSDIDIILLADYLSTSVAQAIDRLGHSPRTPTEARLAERTQPFYASQSTSPAVLMHSLLLSDTSHPAGRRAPIRLDLRVMRPSHFHEVVHSARADLLRGHRYCGRLTEYRNLPTARPLIDRSFTGSEIPSAVPILTESVHLRLESYVLRLENGRFLLGPFGALIFPRVVPVGRHSPTTQRQLHALRRAIKHRLDVERTADHSAGHAFFLSHVRAARIRLDIAEALEAR